MYFEYNETKNSFSFWKALKSYDTEIRYLGSCTNTSIFYLRFDLYMETLFEGILLKIKF